MRRNCSLEGKCDRTSPSLPLPHSTRTHPNRGGGREEEEMQMVVKILRREEEKKKKKAKAEKECWEVE